MTKKKYKNNQFMFVDDDDDDDDDGDDEMYKFNNMMNKVIEMDQEIKMMDDKINNKYNKFNHGGSVKKI